MDILAHALWATRWRSSDSPPMAYCTPHSGRHHSFSRHTRSWTYAADVGVVYRGRGFDGIAWNTPWFMTLNYTALAVVGLWLWNKRLMHRDKH